MLCISSDCIFTIAATLGRESYPKITALRASDDDRDSSYCKGTATSQRHRLFAENIQQFVGLRRRRRRSRACTSGGGGMGRRPPAALQWPCP